MFAKLDVVPRWVIFIIDIFLTVLALLMAKVVRHNFDLDSINMVALNKSVVIAMLINIAMFLSLGIYAGIIRYTSAEDSTRILGALTASSLILFFIHSVVIAFGGAPFISTADIIIYTLFSFVFLITYRVIVKYFFMYIKNLKLDTIRVMVYGAGEAGLATKRTFDHDPNVNKRILAFVDDDERKVGKSIDGVKILDAKNLEELIVQHELDEIIFASYAIPLERKNQIVDICLEHKVRVLNIPARDVWTRKDTKTNQIQNINIEDLLNRDSIQLDNRIIEEELRNKRILITGAAGSIGSEIVRQLMKFNTGMIIICDQGETPLHHLYMELSETHQHSDFFAFIGDVRDKKRMDFLFNKFKPHYVYHAAAYKHVPMMEGNPAESIKTNVLGTKTIADLSVKYGVEKFVMISTDKAVNPTNIMGASKRIAEIYVQSLNNSLSNLDLSINGGLSMKPVTKFITTRFGNVLGSNGSVVPLFKQQIEKGGPVTVTHPDITRYFMTIPEACRLVLEAGSMGHGGEIFVFDMGKSVKIVDMARKMIQLAGLVPDVDIKIAFTGLRPGEKLYEELLNDGENTLPTHHEKIMIGKVREHDFAEVEAQLDELFKLAVINDNNQIVLQMKRIVPEFISMNSVFEKLDLV
ncbi:UDP-N-acetylglucosamine 4,6-dehydratase [Arcticibacter svalbardensis MN12-7]|uniref:UDP-N-acetylglucosamine 4,6-dehydratase n=1 Tax=Arcticibacter svalbardensis MN12-7 TaxID=1150600 RepID=R9GQM4_9SPHI|nr:nucleoside-diphosphate sugar epimerase/dehydratase [Arcticibacter svalbardensis]EOR94018.1 UDP-N-acetylglucosamine 4,6-dehydratase [Arcticibacter svalbardensis MN12-7]